MTKISSRTWHWVRARSQAVVGLATPVLVFGMLATGCGAEPVGEESAPTVSEASSALTYSTALRCGPTDKVCTDVFDFELLSNTVSQVTVKVLRSQVPIRIGAFAPGVSPVTGVNLLTGGVNDLRCSSALLPQKTFKTSTPGIYRIALSRDPTTSTARGDYEVQVTANNTMRGLNVTADDIQTTRPVSCGFKQEISGTWNCASGVNCQDVYDIEMLSNSALYVVLHPNPLFSGTAGRLAVFEQYEPLSGKNLLTGVSKDKNCAGASHTETASIIASAGGHYKVAFGRDARLSTSSLPAGYTASISVDNPSSDAAFVPNFVGRVVNDKASQATGIQCQFTR
ncbi:MAG TPA: hypothetical protein VJV79_12000 [Polyangiaceae bacterium]|nr:hypothetical protein [Polyangiaceae bacterium]